MFNPVFSLDNILKFSKIVILQFTNSPTQILGWRIVCQAMQTEYFSLLDDCLTKFLDQISQFEFLVDKGKAFLFMNFLSSNIYSRFQLIFYLKFAPPLPFLKKVTPSFPIPAIPPKTWGPPPPPPPPPPPHPPIFENLLGGEFWTKFQCQKTLKLTDSLKTQLEDWDFLCSLTEIKTVCINIPVNNSSISRWTAEMSLTLICFYNMLLILIYQYNMQLYS